MGDRTHRATERQEDKSFRIRERDERTHEDACPLRGLRERGQKDVRVLARLVRTQSQSIIHDPLSCHRIMRRACRHGMGCSHGSEREVREGAHGLSTHIP